MACNNCLETRLDHEWMGGMLMAFMINYSEIPYDELLDFVCTWEQTKRDSLWRDFVEAAADLMVAHPKHSTAARANVVQGLQTNVGVFLQCKHSADTLHAS